MMDAVAEEHPLRISLELGEFPACTVTVVVLKDILKDLANLEIILVVLHPDDVTAIFRRFGKMIHIFLLLKCESFPARHLIPHYLEVREFVHQILEILFRRFVPAREGGCGQACKCNHFKYCLLHISFIDNFTKQKANIRKIYIFALFEKI